MGARTELLDTAMRNVSIRSGRKEETLNVPGNLADNYALSATMPPVIIIGATAARDVLMPPDDAANDGLCLTIISKSSVTTGVFTLKTSADVALSPAVTIAQNLSVEMIYLNGLGWRKKAQ